MKNFKKQGCVEFLAEMGSDRSNAIRQYQSIYYIYNRATANNLIRILNYPGSLYIY